MRGKFRPRELVLGALGIGLLAGVGVAPTQAAPITIQKFIPVPADAANVQPGGAFTSFDISYFDPVSGNDYVADRSNASVDIFSGSSLTFLGRATGFTGQAATTSKSGADGVVTVTSGGTTTLYAGDGNSTMKVFNVTNPAAPSLLQSISTGGAFRVDEMAYSPLTHQVIAANNADAPAFATIFSTTNGHSPAAIAHTGISAPGALANDGMEQPVWNSNTGTFFVSIPAFAGDQGGVQEINTDGTLGRTFKFSAMAGGPSSCSPTGLAVGGSGNLMVGCGNAGTQAVLFNPAANGGAGGIVKLFPEISGTDELWYDPTSGNYFVTGKDASGNRVFDVISDLSDLVLQSVVLPVSSLSNPHSISVDPLTGDIFVPLAGNTPSVGGSACELGCIAVFGVPEPGSLPIMLFGAVLILGLGMHRRLSRA